MATVIEEETETVSDEGEVFDLKTLRQRQWKNRLETLGDELDPWELSVSELARKYRDRLPGISSADLRLPARMVVACAFLLKLKAEGLMGRESSNGDEAELDSDLGVLEDYNYEDFAEEDFVPTLKLPVKRIPKRSAHTQELESGFRRAQRIYQQRQREFVEIEGRDSPDWGIHLGEGEGIRDRLHKLYVRVKEKVKRGSNLFFSQLLRKDTREEKLTTFVQLLHLEAEGKVNCSQDSPFGDIQISLAEEEDEVRGQ
ncbi:MAG: hypothetical protein ACLFN4_02545 [Candidatus Acetothermia bacterium]